MSEETHKIRWTVDYSARLTRHQIAMVADSPDGVTDEYREACREWLANNPQGLTREQFDALPDGTVVKPANGYEYVKVGHRLGYSNFENYSISFVVLADADLASMSVVSTPPAPTLDDAQFVLTDDGVWYRVDLDDWACRNSKLTTAELRGIYPTAVILLPGPQIGGDQ